MTSENSVQLPAKSASTFEPIALADRAIPLDPRIEDRPERLLLLHFESEEAAG